MRSRAAKAKSPWRMTRLPERCLRVLIPNTFHGSGALTVRYLDGPAQLAGRPAIRSAGSCGIEGRSRVLSARTSKGVPSDAS